MEAVLFGVSVHFCWFIGADTQTAVIISERDMALESTASLWGRQQGKQTGVVLKETDKYAWEDRAVCWLIQAGRQTPPASQWGSGLINQCLHHDTAPARTQAWVGVCWQGENAWENNTVFNYTDTICSANWYKCAVLTVFHRGSPTELILAVHLPFGVCEMIMCYFDSPLWTFYNYK